MTCADWRSATSEALVRHYERESAFWEHQLDWDTRAAWREVETARRADRLPGVVLTDGREDVRGFAYCFVDGAQAQLGPIVTEAPDDTSSLVDAVLAAARNAGAATSSYFGLRSSLELERALAGAGFDLHPYFYLSRVFDDSPASRDPGLADWSRCDQPAAARLLEAAYGVRGRFFATDGRPDQWTRYVGNLIAFAGCGTFDPGSSCLARAPGELDGLALVTTIRPGVAHLAQLAVHPAAAGRGLGRRLLDEAMARAKGLGCRQMTLLVEASSATAMRLYASRGFTPRATFLGGLRTLGSGL